MTGEDPGEERAAELVRDLLASERADPPDDRLVEGVMRTARWQYATRGALLVSTELVAALTAAAHIVLRSREGSQ